MSSSQQPLRQSGIYRNLPSFDPSIKNLKAIVCGATGISGFHCIRALLDTPRWSKIYALSRSPLSDEILSFLTEEQRSRIQHVSVDLSSSGEQIAKSFKDAGVEADYVFYYAYLLLHRRPSTQHRQERHGPQHRGRLNRGQVSNARTLD